jgi:hypothetical protein
MDYEIKHPTNKDTLEIFPEQKKWSSHRNISIQPSSFKFDSDRGRQNKKQTAPSPNQKFAFAIC